MGLQVSYRIHTKVSKKSNIQSAEKRYTANHTGSMQMERDRDHRRTYDAGPCPLAGERATEIQHLPNHGIFKGKECNDDIRAAREPEIQIREQELLGNGVLREHSGYQYCNRAEIHPRTRETRSDRR